MEKLQIEYLSVAKLKPYEKNTRKHAKKDVDNIAKSIEKYGFADPIGIWGEDNIIVEGHGRLQAAKNLGMTEVPCIRLDHLTEQERREYAIAHNATAELSMWAAEMLELELPELDLSEFEFEFPENETESSNINIDDFFVDAEPKSVCGEVTDSAIFLPLAFIGEMPVNTLLTMMVCQVSIKTAYEILILPITTKIVKVIEKYEERR